jgi:hypothetical protein
MLDWTKIDDLRNGDGFRGQKFSNPLRIALSLLKSEDSLREIVNTGLSKKYAKIVVDIWNPIPKNEDEKTKKTEVQTALVHLFGKISKNLERLKSVSERRTLTVNYKSLKPYFDELEAKFGDSKARMGERALETANPYLTVSIEKSYSDGKTFQTGAKVSSSVEGIWGSWIESAMNLFNGSLFRVSAGGFDYVLGDVAYDIKSGPNVMNKDQVEEAKQKRTIIADLAKSKEFGGYIGVKDFRVATAYGKESDAGIFMKDSGGLIIFGAETWKRLTGDEWNAYRLFLWQIKYKIQIDGNGWDKEQLKDATEHFMKSFYQNYEEKVREAFRMPEYKELEAILK